MTDRKFEPYWTQTDEGCFDFLGRIGNKNLVCRICGAKFEKELDESLGFVIMDTQDLEEHYKTCHSDFINENQLEFHTGLRIPCSTEVPLYDYPHIIVVHESTHKPKTIEQEPYFHVYILRPKKGAKPAPIISTPAPISPAKTKWVTIYRNVGEAKLIDCLAKQLQSLQDAGFDLKSEVRFAIYKNKLGNWSISSKVLKNGTAEDNVELFDVGELNGE
jgi:hypothetical protein